MISFVYVSSMARVFHGEFSRKLSARSRAATLEIAWNFSTKSIRESERSRARARNLPSIVANWSAKTAGSSFSPLLLLACLPAFFLSLAKCFWFSCARRKEERCECVCSWRSLNRYQVAKSCVMDLHLPASNAFQISFYFFFFIWESMTPARGVA